MSEVAGQRYFNYGHGIVSQNCFAKEYSDAGFEVKLVLTGTFVQVHSIRDDDVLFCIVRDDMEVEENQLVCKKADIINVPENLWGPLFTVEKVARLSLVKDSKVAESIGNISVGDAVQVLGPDNSVICIADVVFRNYIERLGVGIYFGLQVTSSKGRLPEIIEKVSLLGPGTKGFPRGCDIVVTIDKIRPNNCSITREKSMRKHDKEFPKELVKSLSGTEDVKIGSFKPLISCNFKENHTGGCKKEHGVCDPDSEPDLNDSCLKKIINSDNPLNVGDEVIYLDGDAPEKGVVIWMGLIENSLKVGVEFENPIGSGTGTVDGLGELFRTKYQHALIVPPMALIKLSDYLVNGSKDTILTKKKNNYSNNYLNQKNINFNLKTNYKSCNNNHNYNNSNNNNNNNNNNNSNNNNNNSNNNNNNNSNNNNNNNFNFNKSISNHDSSNKSNISSNNSNNNIDCRNINDGYWNSKELCRDRKQGTEDIYQMSEKVSVPYQCLHAQNNFGFNDNIQTASKNEVFNGKELFKDGHKLEGERNSKSFDFSKPNDRKTSFKKNYNSVDNSCIQKESNLFVNAQNSQSSPCWNRSSHDLFDLGREKPEKTRHSHCCADKKLQKYSDGEDDLFYHKSAVVYQSSDENVKTFNGKEKWGSHCSDHSSSNENLGNFPFEASKGSHLTGFSAEDLGLGSVVELTFKGEPHYGVIRWIGTFPEEREIGSSRLIAGVEMEEECPGFIDGTDGTFNNRRYFQCNPRKALFVPLSKCRKDSRFLEESQKQSLSPKINYGQIDCPIVEGTVPPINRKGDLESICGKNRGIQGHHNSCYLDATLFSMFAFTSVFDSLLYRPPAKNDISQYSEVQRVLREEIVNPLRKNLYVRADRVMKLRTLLEKLSSVSGLTSEEKDPEEFLNSLLAQILKAEPFLKLSSGQEAFHYQLFVEKDERLLLPSVQQLFEQSFVTSDIKLKQIPSCLIIQMPRFGKSFKMYSKILPPQLLDITDIIENSPRQCTVCGKLAEFECKDCFGQQGIGNGLESISFCKKCLDTAHSHHCRNRHNSRSLTVPVEFYELQEHCIIPRLYMELFAVVCIETSHYVAFVKCGSGSDAPWCFFDSMADRKGEQNGYNIPEMVPCPDLPYWLSEEGVKMLNDMRDERQLPDHAKRLFSDAYMCMYQSPDLMMYR